MKRQIPYALVFIFGVFMIVQYFVPHETSEWIYEFLLEWITIIGIFALALGIWSLVQVSVGKIKHKKEGWPFSYVTLISLVLMIVFGFTGRNEQGEFGLYFMTPEGLDNSMFVHFFDFILIPIQATMFALLAFFIASAAYRAFRARNVLATVLLIAALFQMLRFSPGLGTGLADTASWIMNVPNLAAQRAILIGLGLGMVATSLKILTGIERNYMGR